MKKDCIWVLGRREFYLLLLACPLPWCSRLFSKFQSHCLNHRFYSFSSLYTKERRWNPDYCEQNSDHRGEIKNTYLMLSGNYYLPRVQSPSSSCCQFSDAFTLTSLLSQDLNSGEKGLNDIITFLFPISFPRHEATVKTFGLSTGPTMFSFTDSIPNELWLYFWCTRVYPIDPYHT